MPHTVCAAVWRTNPVASAAKVAKVGAVKHPRNAVSSAVSEMGRLRCGSVSGTVALREPAVVNR